MYEAANRYDEALADYARSLELAPRWAEAYGWRAYAYMSMERFEEAIIDFTRFFELGNEDDFFRYLRARALAQTGHEDEAFEDLDFNIRRLPDAGRVYQRRAELHWYLGRPEEALADLQRSVEVDPGYMPGHRMRAFYGLRHSRSCDDAVRDLQKVDELERGSGGVDHWSWTAQMHVFLLARLCPDLYDHDRALELAGRLADLDPLNADYQNIHGEALYRGGRFNEARDALRRCIDLQYKPHPACLAFLAMTHWKLGNRDEARAFYERAQSRFNAWGPDHPAVADIRREAAEVLGLPP
jgi:tetratricopeptide (TPR) repeat protein